MRKHTHAERGCWRSVQSGDITGQRKARKGRRSGNHATGSYLQVRNLCIPFESTARFLKCLADSVRPQKHQYSIRHQGEEVKAVCQGCQRCLTAAGHQDRRQETYYSVKRDLGQEAMPDLQVSCRALCDQLTFTKLTYRSRIAFLSVA